MKSIFNSHNILLKALLALALCLVSVHAWGGSNYYAKVRIQVSPTGAGSIYAVNASDNSALINENTEVKAYHNYESSATKTVTIKIGATPNTGYLFDESTGWNYSSNENANGTITEDGTYTISGQSNSTDTNSPTNFGSVTATFSAIQYVISLNPNGGTLPGDATAITEYKYNIEGNGTGNISNLPKVERTGYDFNGWEVTSTGTSGWSDHTPGEDDNEMSVVGKWGDVTLKAQWTPHTYTITLNPNGGTLPGGATATTDYKYNIEGNGTGNISNLPKVERTGYDFNGWEVTSTGTSGWSDHTPGEDDNEMSVVGKWGKVTLTAQWTPTTYTIEYYDGEMKLSDLTPKSYTIESKDTLPKLSDNNDYTFYGWQPKQNVGNWEAATQYKAGTSETSLEGMYGNVELNAVWIPVEYKIKLDPNKGKFDDNVTTQIDKKYNAEGSIIDENYISTLPIVTRDYYDFSLWSVVPDDPRFFGWGETADRGESVRGKKGDVTLTAQWTPHTYTITLNLNGGTLSDGATDTGYKYNIEGNGDGNISNLPKVEKTGYSFNGWKVTSTGTSGWSDHTPGVDDNEMSVVGKWGDVTLTAQWEAIPGYIKISVSGLQKNDSAVFEVSYDSVPFVVSLDSSNASGLLVKIPDVGTGKSVTVTPKAWPKNYNGLTLTTPPEEKTVYFSNVRDNPVSYEFILGERNLLNIFETSREF